MEKWRKKGFLTKNSSCGCEPSICLLYGGINSQIEGLLLWTKKRIPNYNLRKPPQFFRQDPHLAGYSIMAAHMDILFK